MRKNKYSLTNKEKEWLKNRVYFIDQCKKCEYQFSFMCRNCPERGYLDSLYPNYYDALMFESRVKIKLISMDYNDVPCAHSMKALCPRKGGSFPGCGNWCLLREAELMVEAEMEHEERMVRNCGVEYLGGRACRYSLWSGKGSSARVESGTRL